MSRARMVGGIWWDQQKNNQKATVKQLELLADAENIVLDDLLDEGLTRGEAQIRLRKALGEGVIPEGVLERQRQRRAEQATQPACRICSSEGWECEGGITRHHFIPRWLMRELENYEAYAPRRLCTIPICVGRHRDLHFRGDNETPKSMIKYLSDDEREFAHRMLDELAEQHPKIIGLIAGGDEASYEYQLIRDWQQGLFARAENAYGVEEIDVREAQVE